MSKVNKELKERIKNLKLEYKSHPQPELLIALPNPRPEADYEIEIDYGEFTSLCPLNPSQPDYASVYIRYIPDKKIVEMKSLKFYLTSYRTVEVFFEEAANRILEDLVKALKPRQMEVVTDWNTRGGTQARVSAGYTKPSRSA